ncbi:MAG: energy-coupled thiamine transporter ThiT [Clostridiaceae bacterium]|nr:energy-coupled thiamine transporter ThiT [Clostridiaceae bacterium]
MFDPASNNALRQQNTREMILATATGGMAIALSTILSILTVIKMPQGGSLTICSMLPLIFCALAFGPAWGIGVCVVYGLLQFIIEPITVHWASIIMDYPLAFGLLGLAGLFAAPAARRKTEKNILRRVGMLPLPRIALAVVVAMGCRLISHVLSGVIFFASYAPEGQNVWVYSFIYNASYLIPEMVITCAVLVPLAAIFSPRKA